jgi:hypothetical protein
MADVEVMAGPNFLSQDHYEVLGCSRLATIEDLTWAYRGLAWKHHPQNQPNDEEASLIFVRVCEAYTALDGVDEEKRGRGRALTLKEANRAYENKFGKFRRLYYDEGGIVGLPHAFVLSERIGGRDTSRGYFLCGEIRVGILRSWCLKTKIHLVLSLAEVVLTWGTIAACKSFYVIWQRLLLLVV